MYINVTVSIPVGIQKSHIPHINSKRPKANDHPQPGNLFALVIEKIKLKHPATHIEAAKKYASTGKEETGSQRHHIPTVMASNPVKSGIHQNLVRPPLKT